MKAPSFNSVAGHDTIAAAAQLLTPTVVTCICRPLHRLTRSHVYVSSLRLGQIECSFLASSSEPYKCFGYYGASSAGCLCPPTHSRIDPTSLEFNGRRKLCKPNVWLSLGTRNDRGRTTWLQQKFDFASLLCQSLAKAAGTSSQNWTCADVPSIQWDTRAWIMVNHWWLLRWQGLECLRALYARREWSKWTSQI